MKRSNKTQTFLCALTISMLSMQAVAQITFEELFKFKRATPLDVKQTEDLGYCITGYTMYAGFGNFDMFLMRLDDTSGVKWVKRYYNAAAFTHGDWAYTLCEAPDSGFVVGGHIAASGFNPGTSYAVIFKTDKNGNLAWEKELNVPNINISKIIPTMDKGYLAVGGYGSGWSFWVNTGGISLIKFDASGSIQWSYQYSDSSFTAGISSVMQLPDSSYIATGGAPGGMLLINLSSSGNVQWARSYGGSKLKPSGNDITRTTDGGYLITAQVDSIIGEGDFCVVKTDVSGNFQWTKVFGTSKKEEAPKINKTAEGNYILHGESYGVPGAWEAILGIKIDDTGKMLWAKGYRGGIHSESVSKDVTKDGGLIMASQYYNSDTFYLVKTDINGISGCTDTSITISDTSLTFISTIPTITKQAGPKDTLIGLTVSNITATRIILCYKNQPAVIPNANFSGDSVMCIGSCMNFTDLSINNPSSWKWKFTGASISTFNGKTPPAVCYNTSGNYTVSLTVSNANGSDSITKTIKVLSVPAVAMTGNTTICSGNTTRLKASGGTSYKWNTGATTDSITITPSVTKKYFVTVSNGICADNDSVLVTVNPSSFLMAAKDTVICNGKTITLTASGATSYQWNTGEITNAITVTPSATTTYTISAKNKGCNDTAIVVVTVGAINILINGEANICSGKSTTLTASGGNNYLWSTGETANSIQVSPATKTTFSVTSSTASCTDTAYFTVNVQATVLPVISYSPDTMITSDGDSVQLETGSYPSLLWSPALGLSCTNCNNPVAKPSKTTTYCVQITYTNVCAETSCRTVYVDIPCGEIFIPTAFSPNNDGVNEIECVLGNCIATLHFSIYDRWGNKVFETTDPQTCWDGTYKGKLMNSSAFIYYMEATLTSGEKITKKGNISLIR
ncbi:MAG: gliding motility-associated C-terminal domain-containing protein [Bacteroidetes bacterium]|nr:gliding motility-associated C-terminal domain-containing protein [Bacteroidota bacterium]